MVKHKDVVIHWLEWDEVPLMCGHGVEFHAGPSPEAATTGDIRIHSLSRSSFEKPANVMTLRY